MSESEKYQILESESLVYLEGEMNRLVEQGYKLNTFTVIEIEGEHCRVPQYVAVMSLSSSTKYDDIANLRDVDPRDVGEYLADGWIVADSWAKNIRMVKKK